MSKSRRHERADSSPPPSTRPSKSGRSPLLIGVLVLVGIGLLYWLRPLPGEDAVPESSSPSPQLNLPASKAPITADAAAEVSGVYDIESYLENDGGCDAPGQPRVDAPKYLLLESSMVGELRMVTAATCQDPAQCESARAKIRANEPFGSDWVRFLTLQRSPTEFSGFTAFGGFGAPERQVCHHRRYENLKFTVFEPGRARFELRTTPLPDRPFDRGGCSAGTDAMEKEAAPLPCGSLVSILLRRSGA